MLLSFSAPSAKLISLDTGSTDSTGPQLDAEAACSDNESEAIAAVGAVAAVPASPPGAASGLALAFGFFFGALVTNVS